MKTGGCVGGGGGKGKSTLTTTKMGISGRGGTRTHTRVAPQGILSPLCLPFHHAALALARNPSAGSYPYQITERRQPCGASASEPQQRSFYRTTPDGPGSAKSCFCSCHEARRLA